MEDLNGAGPAIKEIERLVSAQMKTTILPAPLEPEGSYYLVDNSGGAKLRIAAPGWHDEHLVDIEQLGAFAQVHKTDNSTTFVNESEAVFVKDLADRRDTATCVLIQTPQYLWLSKQAGTALSQAELVRVLRITLRGCLDSESSLLALVRNLKFNRTADGTAELKHARESLGRSITATIEGQTAVPEEVTLSVPVFENYPSSQRIVCAIEVFTQEEKFKLTPYPMEVRFAMDRTLHAIAESLMGDDMPPVFIGQP